MKKAYNVIALCYNRLAGLLKFSHKANRRAEKGKNEVLNCLAAEHFGDSRKVSNVMIGYNKTPWKCISGEEYDVLCNLLTKLNVGGVKLNVSYLD